MAFGQCGIGIARRLRVFRKIERRPDLRNARLCLGRELPFEYWSPLEVHCRTSRRRQCIESEHSRKSFDRGTMIVRVAAEFKHDNLVDPEAPAQCAQLMTPALRRADDVGTNKRIGMGESDALGASLSVRAHARDGDAGLRTGLP